MNLPQHLPTTIPIFPLGGALLLPRARLPLHIFEPRYLQMIEDAMKTPDRLIGMIQPNDLPGCAENSLQDIGCAGRLTQFSETDDGRYLITLGGVSRFRVVNEVEGFTPYRRCDVSWDGFDRDKGPEEKDDEFQRNSFLSLLSKYLEQRELSADWDTVKEADGELLVNSLSMMLDLEPEEKQALLEAPCLGTRRETLVALMEFALRGGNDGEMMQ